MEGVDYLGTGRVFGRHGGQFFLQTDSLLLRVFMGTDRAEVFCHLKEDWGFGVFLEIPEEILEIDGLFVVD